ncbi:MAG: RNA-binding protein [Nanoarchaeota archaeon]
MSTKIYVGNLPFSFDSNSLKDLFMEFGSVTEAVVISDKYSGRSKGFGFVTFESKEAAEKAVAEMNEKEVQGRALKVSEARPMNSDR